MKFTNESKKDIFIFTVLFIFVILAYQQLPQTFYQQDEWLGSGQVKALGYQVVTKDLSYIQLIFGEGRPFARLLGAFFFQQFGFNTVPLAIYSIVFHLLNSFLVYVIAKKVFKKNIPAFIAASFFSLNSVSHQAVSWFGASFGIQPAVFFIFSSLFFYLRYLETDNKKNVYFSFISLLVSLYFKEIGVFLFIFLPLINLLYRRKGLTFRKNLIHHVPFFVFIVLFSLYRFISMLLLGGPSNAKVFLTTSTENLPLTLLSRFFLYPFTSFSLIFIPYPISAALTFGLTKLYYPFIPENISRWDLVSYTVILDLIACVFSFFLIFTFYLIYCKWKEYRRMIIFSIGFFFLSIIPYIVVSKDYAYLEPRYYYLTSAASGMILAILVDAVANMFKNKKAVLVLLLLLSLGYLRYEVKVIRDDVARQVDIASERKQFLQDLHTYLPTLNRNTNIFYFTGNRSWLVDGNKTPFQHGFGYSIMALYYESGKIPRYLPASEYLFKLGEQGYKEMEGLKLGYFHNYEDLKKNIIAKAIDPQNVYSFYYDWDKKKLFDISEETSEKLSNEIKSEGKIN